MDKFTVEETNLMCIYDTSSRAALINDLAAGLHDIYDPDMTEVFAGAIEKLETVTDEEFADIGFYVADDYIDDDGEA